MSDNTSREQETTKTGLPSPWTVRYSRKRKREYFFDPETKQSQWEAPSGTDADALKQYLIKHPLRIRARHILVKHEKSRRPASHRNEHITITEEEAKQELAAIEKRLDAGEKFEDLAEERSDCSSFKRGGDLGWFGRGEMQPSFEKCAFSLEVGQHATVSSDSGCHIVERTG